MATHVEISMKWLLEVLLLRPRSDFKRIETQLVSGGVLITAESYDDRQYEVTLAVTKIREKLPQSQTWYESVQT